MKPIDGREAAAEAQLERLDDAAVDDPPSQDEDPDSATEHVDPDGYGFHVDDPGADLLDEDLDAGLRDDLQADALDALAEAFNARDLDSVLEIVAPDAETPGVLGYDRDNLPTAIEDLWTRRPSCTLTRGRVGTDHVGILWEADDTEWWPIALVHVDDVTDTGVVGVVEVSDDPALLDQVEGEAPDLEDLEEGARWTEWDDGSDGDAPHGP